MKFAFVRMLIGLVTCGAMFAAEPAGAPESAVPAAAAATPFVNRPPYQFLRQNENWSAIAESPAQDFYDPIKYVPLNESGSVWASFGGQVWLRGESWTNFGFSPAESRDGDFGVGRVLLHADLRLGKKIRFFAEGKTALATDRTLPGGRRPLDVDEGDLQQAFVDVKTTLSDKSDMTFRFGRQQLMFGKQRLVSPLPWGNSLRTFDGASIILNVEGWKATGFWTRPAPVRKFALNRPDHRTQFFGVYATRGIAPLGAGLDVYWLDLDRDRSSLGAAAGREQRHSVGAHLSGKIAKSSFDYDVEGTYQFGQFGVDTIRAHSLASQLGHRWTQWKPKPRLYAGFDYASGNKNENGRTGTFNQLFPLGHAFLGFMDSVGRQNVVDFSYGSAWPVHRRLTVDVTAHNFWRASRFDAMYHAGGGVIRAADPSAPSKVGSEADITAKVKVDRHTAVTVGYSRFFAGAFLAATGPREDANFVYVWLQHNF